MYATNALSFASPSMRPAVTRPLSTPCRAIFSSLCLLVPCWPRLWRDGRDGLLNWLPGTSLMLSFLAPPIRFKYLGTVVTDTRQLS
jgi:hypothetical protein